MPLKEALELIRESHSIVLTTHESPDADGLGAEFALAKVLLRAGKDCRVVNSAPIPEKFRFIDRQGLILSLADGPLGPLDKKTTLLVLDTSDIRNVGSIIEYFPPEAGNIYFIDHHEPPEAGGIPQNPGFIDSSAASTCEMIYAIAQALGIPLEAEEAEALFTGISYDTGSFSYQKTGEGAFATALALVRAGAQPFSVHAALHENASAPALLLMKEALASLELRLDNRLAIQTLKKEVFSALGARYEDAEDLINVPLKVKGMEISVLFKENPEGVMRCSLRSKGAVNVAHIAQLFGGGGHKTASGFKCGNNLEEVKERLLSSVSALLEGKPLPKPGKLAPSPPRNRKPSAS